MEEETRQYRDTLASDDNYNNRITEAAEIQSSLLTVKAEVGKGNVCHEECPCQLGLHPAFCPPANTGNHNKRQLPLSFFFFFKAYSLPHFKQREQEQVRGLFLEERRSDVNRR